MPPGRILDAVLIAVWLTAFIVVAMVHPGVANAIIAVVVRCCSAGTTP
jgi:ABC-type antimicrobial peptide transport system permease subunit